MEVSKEQRARRVLAMLQRACNDHQKLTGMEPWEVLLELKEVDGSFFLSAAKHVCQSILPPSMPSIPRLAWEAVFIAYLSVLAGYRPEELGAVFPEEEMEADYATRQELVDRYADDGGFYGSIYRVMDFLLYYPNHTTEYVCCHAAFLLRELRDELPRSLIQSQILPKNLREFFLVLPIWADTPDTEEIAIVADKVFSCMPARNGLSLVKG